jgi:hypothetical protein
LTDANWDTPPITSDDVTIDGDGIAEVNNIVPLWEI